MNTLDFLSSDIEFPCDSNEPKLSASPCSKLPESVDWAFHDFYSTILEKEFTPIESLTEMKYLEPIKQNKEKDYLRDWKHSTIFAVQDKQEDQAVVFVVAQSNNNHRQQQQQQNNNTVTAALKGALYSVEMDMQQNMHDTLRSPLPSKDNNYISWKDDLFTDNFYNTFNNNALGDNNNMMSIDQDLWDDGIELGPPSPAYHSIHDNLVLDSSLPSRISSIMMPTSNTTMMNQQQPMPITIVSEQPPIPSIQVISTSLSNQDNNTAIDATDDQSNKNDAIVTSPSSPTSSTVVQDPIQIKASPSSSKKSKSWTIWNKVKQVAQPLKKSFKSSNHTLSTKNAFKRLFQH
ncbi:unnamed protein product [Cunninghamella echinulata]